MVSVTLEGITKRFDHVVAVERVSLEIQKGELFFLLGPSGCGKTTLLRLIAGFYRPEGGRILFDDRDITGVPPNERNTGMVFQNYALWPHMTVWKNVEYGLSVRKVPAEERSRRVDDALEMVQMQGLRDRSPNQLSGGQQQRVALARALVVEPDVVLLDEPLSNLDARLRLEMREQIQELHREIGITMIYVTHDQKEALAMADRMAIMHQGGVRQVGAPRELYARPSSRFVADFVGEINLLVGEVSSVDEALSVETAMGATRCHTGYEGIEKGDRVSLAVRPEALSFLDEASVGGENTFGGTVRSVTYLGDLEQYTVELEDGTRVKVVEHNPLEQIARPGDRVCVGFDPGSAVILKDEGEAPC
ncbi:MAG: ABC transporter ATP-binding protein [Candidatus Latescibacteria bacterium]|jgi:iron(III) transport system ATP-binding protein|nr:ABC transporter ATP-binding protein [Candidatus Latescibacterota bacterium]